MSTSNPTADSTEPNTQGAAPATPASGWISLALLTTTYAIYAIDKYVLSIVLEPLKHEFALSDSQLGLLTGLASNLPFLVTCIPLAMLADRVNRKWLLVVLVVLWSLSTGLAGFATSLSFLLIARVLVGALEAGFTPLAASMLGDRFPPHRRSTAMGIFNVGATVGVFTALAVGGIIVSEHGWRWAFFIAGMPGVIMGMALAFIEREPKRGAFDAASVTAQPVRRAALRDALAAIWRNPIVRFGMPGLVLCSALPAIAATWIPSILIRVHDFSVQQAGFGGALIQIATAVGAGSGGVIADWLGRKQGWRRLLAAVFGCSSALVIGLIALFAAPNGTAAVALFAVMGFLNALHGGVGLAVVLGNVVPWVRSTVLAVLLIAQNLIAVALVNTLVGLISDWTVGAFGQSSILLGMGSMLFLNVGGVLAFWIAMSAIRRAEGAPRADPSPR